MNDIVSRISGLKRPQLLVRAARHRSKSFHRERHLPRLLGEAEPADAETASARLMSLEAALDDKRRQNAADYDVKRHIEVLSALMAEASRPVSQPPTRQPLTVR